MLLKVAKREESLLFRNISVWQEGKVTPAPGPVCVTFLLVYARITPSVGAQFLRNSSNRGGIPTFWGVYTNLRVIAGKRDVHIADIHGKRRAGERIGC